MPRTLRTITKRELIERLEDSDAPDDALVIFSTDYGDRGNTQQALGISGEIEEVLIHESAYSNSGFAIAEDEDDLDEDDLETNDAKYVVIR